MMKKPNKKTVLIVSVLIILCLGIWTLWGNIALEVNEYEIVSDRIPEAFAGFRIAQVSDLHNKDFGEVSRKKALADFDERQSGSGRVDVADGSE